MTTPQRDCDNDVVAASNPERILRDGCRLVAASSSLQAISNAPITAQSLETTLQEVTPAPLSAESGDTLDTIPAQAESEERLTLRTRPTNIASSANKELLWANRQLLLQPWYRMLS